MNTEIAHRNLEILRNLQPDVKLTVKSQGELKMDERWLNGIRRTATRDSKKDLLNPIEKTFDVLIEDHNFNSSVGYQLSVVLEHLQKTFEKTYPNFQELQELLSKIHRKNDNKVQERESGRQLSAMLDRRSYAVTNDALEQDPAKYVLGLVNLHETGLPEEDQEKLRKFYNSFYFDYSDRNRKTLDTRQYPRVIIYNVILDVLGIESFRFRITGSEYLRVQKEFKDLVQDYIIRR